MSEGKGLQGLPSEAETRSPPAWYDGTAAYDETIPGMPGFVSVAWIEEWTNAVPAHLRRLCEGVAAKRGARYPWWPKQRPMADEFAYLIAMALRQPLDVYGLTRDYLNCERPSDRPPSLFRKLLDQPAGKHPAARLFASIVSDPLAVRHRLLGYSEGLPEALAADPDTPAVLAWAREAFDDLKDAVDLILGPAGPGADGVVLAEAVDPVEAREIAPEAPSVIDAEAGDAAEEPSPAPKAADPELEAAEASLRTAMVAVRDTASDYLASGAVGRSAVVPLGVAVREAFRLARRYDTVLSMPVSIVPILADVQALIDRVQRVLPDKMPAWSTVSEGVGRADSAAIATQAAGLGAVVGRIEASVEIMDARLAEMAALKKYDMGSEISLLHAGATQEAEDLAREIEALAVRIRAAQAEAAIRAAVPERPVPAAAPADAPLPIPASRGVVADQARIHSCSAVLSLGEADGFGYEGAVRTCLGWMREKLAAPLRTEVDPSGVFSVTGQDGTSARGAAVPSGSDRLWVGVFTERDSREKKGRSWRTELCIGENAQKAVHVGIRVWMLGSMGWRPGDRRALPRLVRDIVTAGRVEDAHKPLYAAVKVLSGDDGAAVFQGMLFDGGRKLPILAISDKGGLCADTIDATAKVLAGAVHVVTVDHEAAKAIVRRIGQGWSVEGGEVRIMPAGADPTSDGPGTEPMRQGDVVRLDKGRQGGNSNFVRVISDRILGATESLFADRDLERFEDVFGLGTRSGEAEAVVAAEVAATVPADEVERHREEIDRLRREREDSAALMASFEEEMRAVELENIDAWSRNGALARENERLRALLAQANVPMPVTVPKTVEEICKFAAEEMGPYVTVHPRAIHETARTSHLPVGRLHEGLLFLRDTYVPHRRGEIDRPAYEAALRKIRFEETRSLSDLGALEVFNGYTAQWKGRKVGLDRHLKWGRSAPAMVRIYFHWDEASQELLIGSMPGHLDNFLTN